MEDLNPGKANYFNIWTCWEDVGSGGEFLPSEYYTASSSDSNSS